MELIRKSLFQTTWFVVKNKYTQQKNCRNQWYEYFSFTFAISCGSCWIAGAGREKPRPVTHPAGRADNRVWAGRRQRGGYLIPARRGRHATQIERISSNVPCRLIISQSNKIEKLPCMTENRIKTLYLVLTLSSVLYKFPS